MRDNPNAPIDYLKRYQETIADIEGSGKRPSLFLHACCGPCLTYPLSILVRHFNVTVGFFNPNIYPLEEYEKRRDAMVSFIHAYAKDNGLTIPIVLNEKEDFLSYQEAFKDRSQNREGGPTCLKCHAWRMRLAYAYAADHHFDYFTTVMTVSCKKPSRELNEIAENLQKQFPETRYLFSDFKKENGQLIGIRIARDYHVYRQNYCGCKPSLEERIAYLKRKQEEGQQNKQ